ncbi:DUF1772 domain-containing protein [Streptomyces sp. NBC_01643]|uniref:DUF1772 domain-containing protein n=1 Tax=Streptomyces sp. NBC_01643 TaxID=2975906 RepID=UPI002F90FE47|nr:DUF1772 domain-containing protein [Streptomyces sp. NBC_01643]
MRIQLAKGIALLPTGLMSGAFGYGALNLAPTFRAVSLDMRISFHAELMKMNSTVMQSAMTVAASSTIALVVLAQGSVRRLTTGASLLTVATFLVTRLGNVPINGQIKKWAVSAAPDDHAEILQRWDLYNDIRTVTAVGAFLLLAIMAVGTQQERHLPDER